MENELQVFNNEEFGEVRTLNIEGEPWFVGKDVAEKLGYKDTSDALKRHVEIEDKLTRRFTDSGQSRDMFIINESGLYSLILKSKMPSSKKFKKWVTSEVLPSIRKTGGYVAPVLAGMDNYVLSLAQSMQMTNNVVQGILSSVSRMEEFVKDSINSKDFQIDEARSLIGLRSRNTMSLSNTIKEKLETITGTKIKATNPIYKKIKEKVFKEFHVTRWEEIAVDKYNAVYAYIDSIEKI